MNAPHSGIRSRRQRKMAFAESCHYAHCIGMKPQRQRMMRTILNKFDWGIGARWKWMQKIWRLD